MWNFTPPSSRWCLLNVWDGSLQLQKRFKNIEKFRVRQKFCSACSRWFIATHQSRTQHFSRYLFLDFWPANFRKNMLVSQRWANNSNSPFPRQPTDAWAFLLFLFSSSSHTLEGLTCTLTRVINTNVHGQNLCRTRPPYWFIFFCDFLSYCAFICIK